MIIISVLDIETVLKKWVAGEVNAAHVHEWAEDRFWPGSCEGESDAVLAVLSELDKLNINLIIAEDAPKLIEALHVNNFESFLADYFGSINFEERRRQCREIPFYSPFCQG